MYLTVNGFETAVYYPPDFIKDELEPFLNEMRRRRNERERRILVFLAAPPGAGKSTLAAFLETKGRAGEIQALGIDGFHYPNAYLKTHEILRDSDRIPLMSIKGSPETYDTEALRKKLAEIKENRTVRFPVYDRRIHDPKQDAVPVTGEIILLEGNWLLLREGPWSVLREYADLTARLDVPEEILKERLVGRKMRGGLSEEEAIAWYEAVDGRNIARFFAESDAADITLKLCPQRIQ